VISRSREEKIMEEHKRASEKIKPDPLHSSGLNKLQSFLSDLNDKIEDMTQEGTSVSPRPFSWSTDGRVDWVKFFDHICWDSDIGMEEEEIPSFIANEVKQYMEAVHKIDTEVLFEGIPPLKDDDEKPKTSFLPNLSGDESKE
jgi:hypothetical protein